MQYVFHCVSRIKDSAFNVKKWFDLRVAKNFVDIFWVASCGTWTLLVSINNK